MFNKPPSSYFIFLVVQTALGYSDKLCVNIYLDAFGDGYCTRVQCSSLHRARVHFSEYRCLSTAVPTASGAVTAAGAVRYL